MRFLRASPQRRGEPSPCAVYAGCPQCRAERLCGAGTLRRVIRSRVAAGLAAWVMAASALGPVGVAVAQRSAEPAIDDSQHEPVDPGAVDEGAAQTEDPDDTVDEGHPDIACASRYSATRRRVARRRLS